jgi:hypothetical protein
MLELFWLQVESAVFFESILNIGAFGADWSEAPEENVLGHAIVTTLQRL